MKKTWNYKICQKMEKTEIGPQFQFMASWPKKSNFERIKMFFWVPHFRIFYPYKYQKMIFFHQKQKLDLNFNSWLPGPKHPSLRESKYFWVQKLFWFQDFLHQKHHKIWNISTCKFCDVFDENKSFFDTFKGQKSYYRVP